MCLFEKEKKVDYYLSQFIAHKKNKSKAIDATLTSNH